MYKVVLTLCTLILSNFCSSTSDRICHLNITRTMCTFNNYTHISGNSTDVLNFDNNNLTNFSIFENITIFNNLQINNNNISDIKNIPKGLELLRILGINFNNISVIKNDSFKNFSLLRYINIKNNHISIIEAFAFRLSDLSKLDLTANNISNCTFINHMLNIDTLILSHNQISNINIVNTLSTLKCLYLEYNNINSLNKEFLNNLPNLERLNLSHNQLTNFDYSLPKSSLTIYLQFNKITCITDQHAESRVNLSSNPLCCNFVGIIKNKNKNIFTDSETCEECKSCAKIRAETTTISTSTVTSNPATPVWSLHNVIAISICLLTGVILIVSIVTIAIYKYCCEVTVVYEPAPYFERMSAIYGPCGGEYDAFGYMVPKSIPLQSRELPTIPMSDFLFVEERPTNSEAIYEEVTYV